MPQTHRKNYVPLLLVLFLLCTGAGGTFGQSAPRFSWGAFQRIWNTHAVLGAEINNAQPTAEGYLVSYGFSANLVILIQNDMVYGVRVEFAEEPGREEGGRLFLKAVDSALRVGMYRWPEERRKEVWEKFRIMTPEPVDYQWKTSRFTRARQAENLWVFTLEFITENTSSTLE